MSFSLSFVCKREDVAARVDEQHAPASVKEFIKQAVEHLTSEQVNVYAYGHLCDGPGSYKPSSCSITVNEVEAVAEVSPPVDQPADPQEG